MSLLNKASWDSGTRVCFLTQAQKEFLSNKLACKHSIFSFVPDQQQHLKGMGPSLRLHSKPFTQSYLWTLLRGWPFFQGNPDQRPFENGPSCQVSLRNLLVFKLYQPITVHQPFWSLVHLRLHPENAIEHCAATGEKMVRRPLNWSCDCTDTCLHSMANKMLRQYWQIIWHWAAAIKTQVHLPGMA